MPARLIANQRTFEPPAQQPTCSPFPSWQVDDRNQLILRAGSGKNCAAPPSFEHVRSASGTASRRKKFGPLLSLIFHLYQ